MDAEEGGKQLPRTGAEHGVIVRAVRGDPGTSCLGPVFPNGCGSQFPHTGEGMGRLRGKQAAGQLPVSVFK